MKKIISVIFVLVIVLLITGCGTKKDELYGKWIAKPENQLVFYVNAKETVGGKENYTLEIDGKGNYSLTLDNKETKKGKYTISDNNVTFKDEKDLLIAICKIKEEKELDCREKSTYSIKYTKKEDK
ncbi:MAG: hypothetical protein IKH54_00765 [Bacilli bacterium]|nr:hypothetical protein [Bacilli bacterium]